MTADSSSENATARYTSFPSPRMTRACVYTSHNCRSFFFACYRRTDAETHRNTQETPIHTHTRTHKHAHRNAHSHRHEVWERAHTSSGSAAVDRAADSRTTGATASGEEARLANSAHAHTHTVRTGACVRVCVRVWEGRGRGAHRD